MGRPRPEHPLQVQDTHKDSPARPSITASRPRAPRPRDNLRTSSSLRIPGTALRRGSSTRATRPNLLRASTGSPRRANTLTSNIRRSNNPVLTGSSRRHRTDNNSRTPLRGRHHRALLLRVRHHTSSNSPTLLSHMDLQ